jgi:hypothetical protein
LTKFYAPEKINDDVMGWKWINHPFHPTNPFPVQPIIYLSDAFTSKFDGTEEYE